MEEDYIAGIFDYHGKIVPVIDIARLCRDADLKNSLTTRIIIARLGDESIIGILADNLTQTVNIPPEKFASCGIQQLNAEFLGDVANHNKEMIQLVNVNQLLGTEVRSRLFAAAGAA